jgi:hypothetical protein
MRFAEPGNNRTTVRVGFTERPGRNNFVVCSPVEGNDAWPKAMRSRSNCFQRGPHAQHRDGLVFDAGVVKLFDHTGTSVIGSPREPMVA